MAEPHHDHDASPISRREERALRTALRTFAQPSIGQGDWRDVLRRAADMAPERRVASYERSFHRLRPHHA